MGKCRLCTIEGARGDGWQNGNTSNPRMSKKTNTHKKQHFVPQCYTKAWVDPASREQAKIEPYVWLSDRDGSNTRRKSPGKLFTETDIYTIRSGSNRDLRLEHGFQGLEDKFTRIRNTRFARGEWPSNEEMVWVLAFLATAQARTAGHRDHHRAQWGKIRERMEQFKEGYERASPEGQRAMHSMTPPSLSKGRGMGLEEVRELEANPIQHMIVPVIETVLPMLGRMGVAVLRTNDPIGFVTTDEPCTWYDPEAYKLPPIYRGAALGSRTIEVTLPISPSQCMVLTHRSDLQGYRDVPENVLNILNQRHIAHCSGAFIANSPEIRKEWLEVPPMPEDAWEKVRDKKIASGEWLERKPFATGESSD